MRARRPTVLAVLGFLMVLVGGGAFLLAMAVVIPAGSTQGLSRVGQIWLFGGLGMAVAGVVVLVRLHRRWGPAESYGPGLVVYAWNRWSLIGWNLLLAVGALIFLGAGVTGVIDGLQHLIAGHAGGLWTAFLGFVGLGLGLSALGGWIVTVRRLDHQDPLFMVDDSGIECAQGRIEWRDIDRVLELTEVSGSGDSKRVDRSLAFALRDGKTARPVERAYDDEHVALARFGLQIGITNCTTQARSALATYGHTPVKGELGELLPDEAEVLPPLPAVAPGADDPKIEPAESTGTPPPYWPPPPGWNPSVEQPEVAIVGIEETQAAAEGVPVRAKHPLIRRIRNGLLVVLGLILVLVGVLAIVGGIVGLASRNDNTGVGGLVTSLVIGLLMAAGGVLLMRRFLRRRKPTESTEPRVEIAGP